MSLANLYVAVEVGSLFLVSSCSCILCSGITHPTHTLSKADGFVGSLSSNWCAMIMHLERTRGDGGFDYHSVDIGSAFTSCF